MLDEDAVRKWVIKNVGGLAIDFVLDHMAEVKVFLQREAEKTENTMDDFLVDAVVDWGQGYLEDLKARIA